MNYRLRACREFSCPAGYELVRTVVDAPMDDLWLACSPKGGGGEVKILHIQVLAPAYAAPGQSTSEPCCQTSSISLVSV